MCIYSNWRSRIVRYAKSQGMHFYLCSFSYESCSLYGHLSAFVTCMLTTWTNSIGHCYPWAVDSYSGKRILCYRTWSFVIMITEACYWPSLSQLNVVYIFITYFSKMLFKDIFPSICRSTKVSLPLKFFHPKFYMHFVFPMHAIWSVQIICL